MLGFGVFAFDGCGLVLGLLVLGCASVVCCLRVVLLIWVGCFCGWVVGWLLMLAGFCDAGAVLIG